MEKGLGQRLAAARRAAGLTQQDLCQKSGLSYSTLAKIERGAIKSPSIFTIQQISAALQKPLDELVGNTAFAAQNSVKPAKKRSKSGISFVYFDINGCLVRFFHRAFTQIAKEAQKSPDIVENAFWHYNDAVCRGEMSMAELNRALAKRLDITDFDWAKYYLQAVDSIDETKELVEWAHEHYKIGLLSNIMPGLINQMRSQKIIPDVGYETIIDSSEVGAIKPESKIYEVAGEKSKEDPGSILLIDDSRANLMAAEKMGWHVIWFDDYRPKESVKRIKKALEF